MDVKKKKIQMKNQTLNYRERTGGYQGGGKGLGEIGEGD